MIFEFSMKNTAARTEDAGLCRGFWRRVRFVMGEAVLQCSSSFPSLSSLHHCFIHIGHRPMRCPTALTTQHIITSSALKLPYMFVLAFGCRKRQAFVR
jgi:hypothetical protein